MDLFNADDPSSKSKRVTEEELFKGDLHPRAFMQGVYLVRPGQIPNIKTHPPLWKPNPIHRRVAPVMTMDYGAVLMIEVENPEDPETVSRIFRYLNDHPISPTTLNVPIGEENGKI